MFLLTGLFSILTYIYKTKIMMFLNFLSYLPTRWPFSPSDCIHVCVCTWVCGHPCKYVCVIHINACASNDSRAFPWVPRISWHTFFTINCLDAVELRTAPERLLEKYVSDNPNPLQEQLRFPVLLGDTSEGTLTSTCTGRHCVCVWRTVTNRRHRCCHLHTQWP